jgi:hypothetical protein
MRTRATTSWHARVLHGAWLGLRPSLTLARVKLDTEQKANDCWVHVCGVAWSFQTTFPADVWQEAGGQLTPQEAAGLQRWRDATAANAQHPANTGPWVTKEDLEAAGLIDEPYHVQVGL